MRRALYSLKEKIGTHKLILRFIENLECASIYREPGSKILQKIRACVRKCDDTSACVFESIHEALMLKFFCDIIQDIQLDEFIAVGMKLHS